MNEFTFIPQRDFMDCGPACLAMISMYHSRKYPIEYLRKKSYITKDGVSLLGLKEAAKDIGLDSISTKLKVTDLVKKSCYFPCILYWNQKHFVVLYKIKGKYFFIADPEFGKIKLSLDKFEKSWLSDDDCGVALFLQPTSEFYKKQPPPSKKFSILFIFHYLGPFKKEFAILFFLLFLSSLVSLFFPFLTETLIDKGVYAKDLDFIFLILLAQLSLFLGSLVFNIYRNWLILYIGSNLGIMIISEFLKRMFKLPIKFFDTKLMGDFQQRIHDNERIEEFLTSQGLSSFFSIITFLVFFGVLWYYDFNILLVYFLLTVSSIFWSYFWLHRRKVLDYIRFQQRGESHVEIPDHVDPPFWFMLTHHSGMLTHLFF